MKQTKQFNIPKYLVLQAYELVKTNAGAAGVDKQSLEDFEKNLKNNLYKIWNRLSSGTYFPPPVKAVEIPKKSGKEKRILGVPTVADRIAQMTVKLQFEPKVEPYFLEDSYGYRPNKSALDAISVTRKRCWQYDWVLEFDIVGLFDNISHELLQKAIDKHTDCRWTKLYIKRWLKAPMEMPDGTLKERDCGTPQGGVVSPVLSNLFLHYVFDKWMEQNYSHIEWCRYADDGLVHCKTLKQAEYLLEKLKQRFEECGLKLHPEKTQIVYCKDGKRKGKHDKMKFNFLGYCFRGRKCKTKKNDFFISFTPAVSSEAMKSMRKKTKSLRWNTRADLSLNEIAKRMNPILQGWLNYYGCFCRSQMYSVFHHFDKTLAAWARRKYKNLRHHKTRATTWLEKIAKREPTLFVHWRIGMVGSFA